MSVGFILPETVVLDEGWSDGAPVVELGATKTAPEGVTSGE